MAKIEIYARIRPPKRPHSGIQVTTDQDSGHERIHLETGDQDRLSTPPRYNRSHSSSHNFQFKRVFRETASQEEVFDAVSAHIIDSFLEGYNGTIFAYGQTSSGKTHTIEGSGRKFADRGIIPRSLSYIYREVEKRNEKGEEINVHLSYMEIYQDTGYDLLNPGMRPGALMVTLPKIHISEGPGGHVTVRNLSSHLAATEEVAQSLLFQGSTCRKVAETSMNQCSSRSHSIFTITLTAKAIDSEIITKSKLNLVDLAGSERVAKTGAGGRILQEAKHINLSLHHLEHVIVTLQHHLKSSNSSTGVSPSPSGTSLSAKKSRERTPTNHRQQSPQTPKSRGGRTLSSSSQRPGTRGGHVPYRNCMLTMVLKDSLGGNCLTAMIATVSVEEDNLWETISTCRFSQRVACISNKARKNEELDDKAVIKKLNQRIAELESEVSLLKGQAVQQVGTGVVSDSSKALTEAEKVACHQILHGFFHGKIDNPVAAGVNTVAMFHECLQVLKMVVLQALGINKPSSVETTAHASELASQVKDSLKSSTTTPSPNSRLSSGFGSLVDEDGVTTCESSHNQDSLDIQHVQSPSQKKKNTPPHDQIPSVKDQLTEQRRHKKHKHKHTNEHQDDHRPSVKSENKSPTKSDSTNTRSNSQKHTPPVRGFTGPIQSEDSPRHVGRAWVSPVTSPRSSSEITNPVPSRHSSQHVDNHRSPNSQASSSFQDSSPSLYNQTKPLSPREERAVQKLVTQQVELDRSRIEQKKLKSQVQLLDLHVEEEKLKSELNQISEQLANQHVHVTMLQKSQSNNEQLCAERIAEQQLRIKQAKTHQRLMDIQYHIHSSHHPASDSNTPVAFTQTLTAANLLSPTPMMKSPRQYHPVPLSNKVQKELEKHELKQTQVQNEIEKLRMSQVEKQLELKEASTRRKILALKQQLLSNQNSSLQTTPSNRSTSTAIFQPEFRNPPFTPPTPENTRPLGKDKNASQLKNAAFDGRLLSEAIDSHYVKLPSNHTPADYSSPLTNGYRLRSTTSTSNAPQVTQNSSVNETRSSVHVPVNIKTPITSPSFSNTLSNTLSNTHAEKNLQLPPKTGPKSPGNRLQDKSNTEPSSKASSTKNTPVKLTLPDEIKETEYMTALQRQKSRVSRIRRCIVAATVIQRAWRDYKGLS